MKKVLLIGVYPPPIGGVSIHLERFLNANKSDVEIGLLDLKKRKVFFKTGSYEGFKEICIYVLKSDIVHIHLSSNLKIVLALLFKTLGKKVVFTQHNNIVSQFEKNIFFKLFDHVIFVNGKCLNDKDIKNKKANFSVIPAFIPPVSVEKNPDWLTAKLNKFDKLIVTNCYRLNYTNDGGEVYGFDIIEKAFLKLNESDSISSTCLLFVDPSGTYKEKLESCIDSFVSRSGNFIMYTDSKNISFYELLKLADVSIRATRSDGDSLSIRESLYLGVSTIASDVVERPEGCIKFTGLSSIDLAKKIKNAINLSNDFLAEKENFHQDIIDVYKNISN